MKVQVIGVYERTVRCVLTGSRGRISTSKRAWLVLRVGRRLQAIGISHEAYRGLRKSGVPRERHPIHELRKGRP
jgi:hypothetical protein